MSLEIISTVVGGLVLAFLFFVMKEKICPLPNIVGRWYFEMHTENTSFQPFQDMRLTYVAMISREGNMVDGSIEKIHEKSSTGEKDYVGSERTRGEVRGYIEKNYLGKDRVFLHIREFGKNRESTCFHTLTVSSKDCMVGTFMSTVAEQDGTVSWQRDS
ncbi:MAG: hypothetical protein OYK82_01875 [Gammaproteobacteria bacterium]|nr:hypothetical protein [Gammaproteobacteria bacterium]